MFLIKFKNNTEHYTCVASSGEELGFGWAKCDTCGCLAGERFRATGMYRDDNGEQIHDELHVCWDCVIFIANGDLPLDE